ncbi:hypothetical protein NEMBOFW57_009132 [Staphylotrichum longicolle]|uniref:Fe2OG dioxygenase domain-containing protein n=1 Tax=Staphylotrichum longicolle TaxID=669026 RepID=A0AAD4HXY2_9PEZI|nr:hypothetical protein NEMBOFW57_009132 [Staphylotrichum longicolle]
MPPTFDINPSVIPMVQTRKALLILDLQNDFVSADGALRTAEPEGYVERILDVAKAFRDSGAGDVIWVRSEFERHCSLLEDGDQIITADSLLRPKKAAPSRGRQPTSNVHESAAMEDDDEAFLSVGAGEEKKQCVRKGTPGAEFAPEVKAAVVTGRDIVFTKTHYSAFASGQQQLVQLLRGRFVTQLYVCGALTNISIYATALGAGQHGYEVTLVEDCCGFRSAMRHLNAVRQLGHLTGCDVLTSEALLEQLQPPLAPAPTRSTGLSPAISKISLGLGGGGSGGGGSGSPVASPAVAPRPISPSSPSAASPQPDRDSPRRTPFSRRSASHQSRPKVGSTRPSSDTAPLEAASDPSTPETPASESTQSPEEKPREAQRNARSATAEQGELESSKGPALPPGPGSAKAEKPRVINRVRQRVQRPSSDKKSSTPSSPEKIAVRSKTPKNAVKPEAETTAEPERIVAHTESEPAPPPPPPIMADDQNPAPVCSEPLCEGDTTVITNVLPPALAADAFDRLLEEVSWAGMSHMGGEVPRRIAVQGTVAEDGSMPVYRHPADESPPLSPFSPTVLQIKDEVEKHLGHPLNHVLIQHYRTGNDYISEHSDKTLDIAKGSFIANVSLGAERTMVFRTKRPSKDKTATSPSKPTPSPASPVKSTTTTASPSEADSAPAPAPAPAPTPTQTQTAPTPPPARQTHRAPLPHNSLLRMGLLTNTTHLHAIRPDKRPAQAKSPAELAHHGARISLTFRHIATFIDASSSLIWGQGATSKSRGGARAVVNGQTDEAVRLLQAFGAENNQGRGFDWEGWYGAGFDVLHMGTPKRVFASAADAVGSLAVGLALAELGVGCAKGVVEGAGKEVRFEDNDVGRAVVDGAGEVLRYLDAVYGAGRRYDQMLPKEVARRFGGLKRGLELGEWWRGVAGEDGEEGKEGVKKMVEKELVEWEGRAKEAAAAVAPENGEESTDGGGFFIAGGNQPSPADFALWPVLHDMVRVCGKGVLGENLGRYYNTFKGRSSVAKVLGSKAE